MRHTFALAALVVIGFEQHALALPQYAVRSGRTCGNCHISPTYEDPSGWVDPDLALRKCNMSCMACHVNPGGGGMRNTSGRYYGQSTLSIIPLQERSYSDYGREILGARVVQEIRRANWPLARPKGGERTIPSNWTEVQRKVGADKSGGFSSFGKPAGGPNEMAFWDGRYGDLNADPLLSFGGDFRIAYWSASSTFFPMQADLHAAFHPVEHLTGSVTVSGRGRTGGLGQTLEQDRFPVFLRNAFLMIHELPYMTYEKAGLLLPSFGTHIDDHTSFTRSFFELDVSTPDDIVLGLETGLAANYPFFSASFFRNVRPYGSPEDANPGWGGSAMVGWRDLAWHVSLSGIIKRRDLAARGDLEAVALGVGFNPFTYSNSVPLTYLGEVVVGRRSRALTGEMTAVWAVYQELWWTIFNGVSLRAKYDVGRRDAELADTLEHRVSAGFDISPLPGVTLIALGRTLWLSGANTELDVFVHSHLWF